MTIRNITNLTSVALAVAVIAFAAPVAHSQMRVYDMTSGRSTSYGSTSGMYNQGNANNSFYGYRPYLYNNYGMYYPPGGALVLGSDGQLYNPFLDNGTVEPTVEADGVTFPAPITQLPGEQNPVQYSDQIEAVRLPGNQVRLAWSGDPRPVASMRFSLLDRKRQELRNATVTSLPAEAIFSRPSTAAYYRVVISYNDGAVRSIVAPL